MLEKVLQMLSDIIGTKLLNQLDYVRLCVFLFAMLSKVDSTFLYCDFVLKFQFNNQNFLGKNPPHQCECSSAQAIWKQRRHPKTPKLQICPPSCQELFVQFFH